MTRHSKPKRTNRRIAMTARSIAAIKPEANSVDWFDTATSGLALKVQPTGSRAWFFFYRNAGTVRRTRLGSYPAVELSKARKLARATRVRVETEGADPASERAEARTVFTVGDLCDLFIEQYAKPKKRTWKDDQWRIEKYVKPAWGSRAVADVTRADAHALLDKIASDGKGTQANRVQALISKLWNVAIDREHTDANICHRMAKRAPETVRGRTLTDAELKDLWRYLDAHPGPASDAIRLRLLTGARGGEVHRMAWADVDLDAKVWTIPAKHAKNNRAVTVPLSASALAVLNARRAEADKAEPNVFPGLYHQREDLRDMGEIHAGAYRWHDLRRTVGTRMAALGIAEETISRVLNHAKRGVTATVYNQHAYDNEKRAALDLWARELAAVVTGKRQAAKVLPMGR